MMKKIIITLLMTAATFPVFADPKPYQVEVLVFQNTSARTELKEALTTSLAQPKLTKCETPSITNTNFHLVEPAQLRLMNEHRRLQQSGRYKVLLHLGWTQSLPTEAAAIGSHVFAKSPQSNSEVGTLGDYAELPMLIDGTVTLSQAKKIRSNVDFVMNTANASIRLHQQAFISPGELYYFDHPLYGVLVKIQAA